MVVNSNTNIQQKLALFPCIHSFYLKPYTAIFLPSVAISHWKRELQFPHQNDHSSPNFPKVPDKREAVLAITTPMVHIDNFDLGKFCGKILYPSDIKLRFLCMSPYWLVKIIYNTITSCTNYSIINHRIVCLESQMQEISYFLHGICPHGNHNTLCHFIIKKLLSPFAQENKVCICQIRTLFPEYLFSAEGG